MKESDYQESVIDRIESEYPGATVLKNDENYIQGFPDLTVLFPDGRWAVLECKRDAKAKHQPNQDYYISDLDSKGFGAFIYPENEEEVFDGLEKAFGGNR